MKLTRSVIIGCLLLGGAASAGVPVRRDLHAYKHLDGLMTSRPRQIEEKKLDPLADWKLTGVSELENGYFVTLSHRKNAGEQMVIRPSGNSSFTVERVEFAGDWRQLVVHLNCGGSSAAIRFDESPPVPAASVTKTEATPRPAAPAGRPRGVPAPASPSSPVSAPAR